MRILGIETSCDETSASVLRGNGDSVVLESLVILSQDVHRIFGGVVPEIASRQHLTSILPVIDQALADAGADFAGRAGPTGWDGWCAVGLCDKRAELALHPAHVG